MINSQYIFYVHFIIYQLSFFSLENGWQAERQIQREREREREREGNSQDIHTERERETVYSERLTSSLCLHEAGIEPA